MSTEALGSSILHLLAGLPISRSTLPSLNSTEHKTPLEIKCSDFMIHLSGGVSLHRPGPLQKTTSMALFVYSKENNILVFSPNDASYCAAGHIHGDAMSHFYHLFPTTVLSTVSTGHH